MCTKMNSELFSGDSDDDTGFRTENTYAKSYDSWRKKEELNKLKTKYGDDVLDGSDSSSSSGEDDEAVELTQEVEKDFFKTLSYLKKKDPKIYDNNIEFFKETNQVKKTKSKKEETMFLKDYERKLLLNEDGLDNSEPATETNQSELEKIRQQLKNVDDSDDEDILQVRQKTTKEQTEFNEHIRFLAGETDDIKDETIKTDLKPLKEYWSDPNLDNGEKFLRDYILNKRYLEKGDSKIPTYDEIVEFDEDEIDRQEEFEHKYNFRFEEPDQEFIKRYPRTIEQSLRQGDDRRKVKRAETKERKKQEKEEKREDIKKMQELKRKEIEEKLEKLKEVTGIEQDLPFDDLDADFNPEEHDKKMQQFFNDEFYQGEEGDEKPEFADIDEELEIENWHNYNEEAHCEDDNFNMDADYDPANQQVDVKKQKKRKKKSKLAEALSKPKPKFDPNDKNYEKYFEEYYKLDCEDFIGDMPCRFKYREVAPNNFGLTVEEILMAKDRELNKWCSLKKTFQIRPDHVEKYDQIAYAKKGNDINLKRRMLPSLFAPEEEVAETSGGKKEEDPQNDSKKTTKVEDKKRKRQNRKNDEGQKKRKRNSEEKIAISDARLTAFGINPKKFKNKLKYGNKNKNI